jgi:hypothetical protein
VLEVPGIQDKVGKIVAGAYSLVFLLSKIDGVRETKGYAKATRVASVAAKQQ